jgi:processive 1,2-diacylglycerol beta-glucosyltransferase
MTTRLLILTAGFGEGHNAAARALAAACEARHGPGSAPVVDAFAVAMPRLNAIARRAYLRLINGAPGVWSTLYRWLDTSSFAGRGLGRLPAERRVLREAVARLQPEAIVCTFPGYAFALAALEREGAIAGPYFNVVTDSISLHSFWWQAGAAGWFLPNEDSAAVLRRAGVEPARVHVTGFPVQPFFAAHAGRLAPPDLATGATPRVLFIIHSGRRHARATAERLLRETDWEITCTVGRDTRLRFALERLAAGRPARTAVLGWTDEIPRLLMTHHVVVSKAGGATTQEALAARCPMIVNQVVPGQEEGNAELLRRHGIGVRAETPEAVLASLRAAFADGGRRWSEWRAAIAPLYRPAAADYTVASILALARERPPRAASLVVPPVPALSA